MNKRNMFDELMGGLDSLKQEREGKLTLRQHEVEQKQPIEMPGAEIIALRSKLHVSRGVFADWLRVSPRSLERWEQSSVTGSTAVLLRLVDEDPEAILPKLQAM